tara:strand:+ start:3341 stop:3712 length:372 start_codon:yes stop_codon:yes gene_type:complete
MNETSLSKYLIKHFRVMGAFVQRLEVTTGAGVPDLAVVLKGKTHWVELKWNTKHIRSVQFVWGAKAHNAGALVNYVVGREKTIELYNIVDAVPMTNTFKVTTLINVFDKTPAGVEKLLDSLQT